MEIKFIGTIDEIRTEAQNSGIVMIGRGRCTNKIPLIKWVREQYGLGLKDAKECVEHILNFQMYNG